MRYTVVLEESKEGFAVSVPGLPGCLTQGDTEDEALANASIAIRAWLEAVGELASTGAGRRVYVEVACPLRNQVFLHIGMPLSAMLHRAKDQYIIQPIIYAMKAIPAHPIPCSWLPSWIRPVGILW